ncbi:NACHT domain-containing protein [Micromonospora purpureochromogenes]|nr:NACHT domain-containing protein [Micromonospora purpureochromogenes]
MVLIWAAKLFLSESLKDGGKRFSLWIFRARKSLSKRQVDKYRKHLIVNYGRHALGFLRGQSVDVGKVYVPLQFEDSGHRRDIFDEIRRHDRCVVLGGAGAGKSMLLKASIHRWAHGGGGTRVPILVELHRMNEDGATVFDLVIDAVERNGIRDGRDVVRNSLEEGKICLLLDGLDEVSSSRRSDVSRRIKDLAETYAKCQVVVTCRDAIYDSSLLPAFEHHIKIAEFDDASIRRFISSWYTARGVSPEIRRRNVATMLAELRGNSAVLRLARTPLLLAIMVSLFDADPGVGPSLLRSRADFYKEAVEHLLRRDHDLGRHGHVAVYKAGHKAIVLRRLALFTQGAGDSETDGKTISELDVLRLMAVVLPELNLEPSKHSTPMFDEIVKRSEIMAEIDEGSLLYKFAHLTFQEYLSAIELADQPDKLLALYRDNPGRWRETVKLWCAAVNRDCGTLIGSIFGGRPSDKLLALECIPEAKRVDEEVAGRIISHFLASLSSARIDEGAVVALGAVASSRGPRGSDVLRRLVAMATSGSGFQTRPKLAMQALAAARTPEAIHVLGELAERSEAARSALRAMGEVAVPELLMAVRKGQAAAIDYIGEVATPSAAIALSTLIWEESGPARRAAWWLASLIITPDIEEELRLAEPQLDLTQPRLDWIWKPFAHQMGEPLGALIGRVGWLIDSSSDDCIPEQLGTIDVRIGLPIGVFGAAETFKRGYVPFGDAEVVRRADDLVTRARAATVSRLTRTRLSHYLDTAYRSRDFSYVSEHTDPSGTAELCSRVLEKAEVPARYRTIFRKLPPRVMAYAVPAFFWSGGHKVDRKQWLKVNRKPIDEEVFMVPGVVALVALLILPAILGLARFSFNLFGFWPWLPSAVLQGMAILAAVLIITCCLLLLTKGNSGSLARRLVPIVASACGTVLFVLLTALGWRSLAGWLGIFGTIAFGSMFLVVSIVGLTLPGDGINGGSRHKLRTALRLGNYEEKSATIVA